MSFNPAEVTKELAKQGQLVVRIPVTEGVRPHEALPTQTNDGRAIKLLALVVEGGRTVVYGMLNMFK